MKRLPYKSPHILVEEMETGGRLLFKASGDVTLDDSRDVSDESTLPPQDTRKFWSTEDW